jgi:hypothetical protein
MNKEQMQGNITDGKVPFHLLRAEALCAALIDHGLSFDRIDLQLLGAFRKSYRNDIDTLKLPSDAYDEVLLTLNRDGLYDKLPEGLFHQTRGGSNTSSLKAMVGEYKQFREEEKNARRFFQPLETEFFRYATMTEEEERKLVFGILNGRLNREFYSFWNIDENLPPEPASVLVLIMPWIRQIKGNMELTAKSLSMILHKKVNATLEIRTETTSKNAGFQLDESAVLGIDTIAGQQLDEPYVVWKFTIEDLSTAEINAFVPEQAYSKLMERFDELFIPLDVTLELIYKPKAGHVEKEEAVLGLGFYL